MLEPAFMNDTVMKNGEEDEELAIGMREVDNELDIFPPDRDYIEHLPFSSKSRTFLTPLLKNEHQAIEDNESRPQASDLSEMKYDLPPSAKVAGIEDQEEFEEWNKCLDQLKIRLEYGQRQMVNIELMKTHGNLAWEQCIKETESIEFTLKSGLTDLKKKQQILEELEWKRKSDNELVTKQLGILQGEWQSLEERHRVLLEAIRKL